jgi:Zn-finger nucleic acid-binding protein
MTRNCTNCGAPLVQVDGKMHLRCEHCASFWFPPESEEGVKTLHEPADHDCPVCTSRLIAATIEDQPVAHCPRCRGILATTRHFFEIVTTRRMRLKPPFAPQKPIDRTELSRLIACPSCRETMDVHPYHGPGNAVVDTCGSCLLVWLDHSELTVIASARRGMI